MNKICVFTVLAMLLIGGLFLSEASFCLAQSASDWGTVQPTALIEVQSITTIDHAIQVKMSISPPVPTSDEVMEVFLKIISPDGLSTTEGPFYIESTGTHTVLYTPTQIGTYRFQLDYAGQNFTNNNVTYLPALSAPTQLLVTPAPTPSPTPQVITWTKANSPHILTGSVTVESGATLLIEPGAIVNLKGHSITANGKLTAIGTASEPIQFNNGSITISSLSVIKQAILNSTSLILLGDGPIVTRNIINGSFSGTGISCKGSNANITGNLISNWETGISAGYSQMMGSSYDTARIENNLIISNDVGISFSQWLRAWVSNSYAKTIRNNTLASNSVGIAVNVNYQLDGDPNKIMMNIALINNNFQANNGNIHSILSINATNNWWGTTDELIIAETVSNTVIFAPFLTEPNTNAPTATFIPVPIPTPMPTPTATPTPTPTPPADTTPQPTNTPISTPTPMPTPTATPTPTPTQSLSPSPEHSPSPQPTHTDQINTPSITPSPTVPEFPFLTITPLLIIATLLAVVYVKKRA